MEKPLEITFKLSACGDGYYVQDWFKGGCNTLALAEKQPSVEDAEKVLTEHYLGPDCEGIGVLWEIKPGE